MLANKACSDEHSAVLVLLACYPPRMCEIRLALNSVDTKMLLSYTVCI